MKTFRSEGGPDRVEYVIRADFETVVKSEAKQASSLTARPKAQHLLMDQHQAIPRCKPLATR